MPEPKYKIPSNAAFSHSLVTILTDKSNQKYGTYLYSRQVIKFITHKGVTPKAMSTFILLMAHVQWISSVLEMFHHSSTDFSYDCISINILLQQSGHPVKTNFLVSCTTLWPIRRYASISVTGTHQSTLIGRFNNLLVTSHGSNFWATTVTYTSDVHVVVTV
jgi:hypothetical protein